MYIFSGMRVFTVCVYNICACMLKSTVKSIKLSSRFAMYGQNYLFIIIVAQVAVQTHLNYLNHTFK